MRAITAREGQLARNASGFGFFTVSYQKVPYCEKKVTGVLCTMRQLKIHWARFERKRIVTMNIAIFGAGPVGNQLTTLCEAAGHQVLVCTRSAPSASSSRVTHRFEAGARQAEAVVLAIPFRVAVEVLRPLKSLLHGKIVIDCTNPLNADWSPMLLGQTNSAAEEIARALPGARVVKAFNTIFADVMPAARRDRSGLRSTAFVAGDEDVAKQSVMQLATSFGFSSADVGPLWVARHLESMAQLNIQIAIGQKGGTNAAFIYHQGA